MIIDPVAFYLGSLAIRWYGIIITSAVFLGVFLTLREAERQQMDQDFFLDFFIFGIPAAIIGARIYFVAFSWESFKPNLLKILAFREGGLAIHGAIIGGLIVLFYLCKKRKVSFWQSVDIMAPPLVLGQAIGRWGNFFNQEAHGGVVSKEFINHFPEFIQRQMYIYGNYYQPTFLYESVWDLFIFFLLIFLRRKKSIKRGDVFLIYAVGYSLGRFFIEGLRTDSLMLGSLRVAQLLSAIVVIFGSFLLYWRHRKGKVFYVK